MKLYATIVVSSFILTGCGPSPRQLEMQAQQARIQQQDRASNEDMQTCSITYPVEQRSPKNAVAMANCVLSAYERRATKNDLVEAIQYKRLELAEKYAAGKLTLAEYASQFRDYSASIHSQLIMRENQAQMVAAAQSTAKSAQCAVAQQRSANSDYTGVNSTNGYVAVASLLGAIGDGVHVASACN